MQNKFGRMALGILAASLVVGGCERHVDDTHFGTLDRVEIRDRATDALYLETHGDHWDGPGIPHLHVGEEIALNIHFFDVEGNEAHLGANEEFSVGVRLADTGTSGIVGFEAHGDHVDVEGLAVGQTHLVFELRHGGHADDHTPPVEFVVEAH